MFGFLDSAEERQQLFALAADLQTLLVRAYADAEVSSDAQAAVDVAIGPCAALIRIGETVVWCSERDGGLPTAYAMLVRYGASESQSLAAVREFVAQEGGPWIR